MPKFKTTLLLSIFLLDMVGAAFGQRTLGKGLLSVNFDGKTTIAFYTNPSDKSPSKTIEFFNDKSNNSWNIKNLATQKEWLSPEILWLDYSPLVFRIKSSNDKWAEVIVNNATGKSYWIKKNNSMTSHTWEAFLKDKFGVSRASDQKIKKLPSATSSDLIYKGEDCFRVKSMKGDWIEIFSADYCDESYTRSKTKISSGWIKWRDGNKLLIEYFITG